MKFKFFSRVSTFFRRIFSGKQLFSDERTYSLDSFISHIHDSTFFQLTSQESGVLASSADNQMPEITMYRIYGVSLGVAEVLSEKNHDAAEQLARAEYEKAASEGQVVSSKLFKLMHVPVDTDEKPTVRLIRRIDDVDRTDLKRMDKVQRLLGPYAVKLYHHRLFLNPEATFTEYAYINEMEYIPGLRNVKDDLERIDGTKAKEKAERLLLLTRKMLNLVKYLQKKRLYWPDIKPSNFYIRPDTDELCVADNKNLFTKKNKFLPRAAFTPDYTAPSVRGYDAVRNPKRVSFSEYSDQLHFSFLKTVETLLDLCDKTQPAAIQVMDYLQDARAPHTLSIFKPEKILYPAKRAVKEVLPVSPAVDSHSIFKRCNSNSNVHRRLSWFSGGFFWKRFAESKKPEAVERPAEKMPKSTALFKRLFGSTGGR